MARDKTASSLHGMANVPVFEFDRDGFHVLQTCRASNEAFKALCKRRLRPGKVSGPAPGNYANVTAEVWWLAQLMHYGLASDPIITVEQAHRQFRSVLRVKGNLHVPAYVRKVEERLRISFEMSQRPIATPMNVDACSRRDPGLRIKGAASRQTMGPGVLGYDERLIDQQSRRSHDSAPIVDGQPPYQPRSESGVGLHLEQHQPSHFSLIGPSASNDTSLNFSATASFDFQSDPHHVPTPHTPLQSLSPSIRRQIRSANVSPQTLRPGLTSNLLARLEGVVAKLEDRERTMEREDRSPRRDTQDSTMTGISTGLAWDEHQWAEWDDALQDHALNLERRARFEQRVKRARDIMRGVNDSPGGSYYTYEDGPQSEDDEGDTRMSDTVSKDSESCSDQDATPPPSNLDVIASRTCSTVKPQHQHVTPYHLVMSNWIATRSPLVGLPAFQRLRVIAVSEDYPGTFFENAPICKRCGHHLRRCQCEQCHSCAEVRDRCFCQPCSLCRRARDGECQCGVCSFCGERDNQTLNLRCACYCSCGCPIFGANCCLVTKEAKRERKFLVKAQERRNVDFTQRQANLVMMQRMYAWVERKEWLSAELAAPRTEQSRLLGDVSGRYQLLFNRRVHRPTDKPCEIVIKQNGSRLYGRYFYGEHIQGLFSSKIAPKYATTAAIPCEVAIADWQRDDNRWLTHIQAAVSHDPDIDTDDGITFLGNGLIKLSAKFLGYTYSHALDFVVFGIKRDSDDTAIGGSIEHDDPDLDDLETFEEMWRVVHMTKCSGHACREKHGFDEAGRKSPVFEPALSDSPPWDEAAVDRWVNYLCEDDGRSAAMERAADMR